ncbi:translation initiation factor [Flagellimonas sp.]|uniref:translation initiation factor n=1 Tax=Flagellimonas sp. TaxID=2058762 RepID=UPI003F4A8360
MDLQDQLKNLFPDHTPEETDNTKEESPYWLQEEPLLCKYEKRKGKPVTIIDGYNGADADFKKLTKDLKSMLSVGGSFKNDSIIIQGDYRDKIMEFLKSNGFSVKRVGG